MKTLLATLLFVLLFAPIAANAQCVDLCTFLTNGGFQNGLASWNCSEPNNNYNCPGGPVPNVPAFIIPTAPDDGFIGVLNPGDGDIAGKVVHDAQAIAPGTPCFTATILANRGRFPDTLDPFISRRPTLHLRIQGWRAGPQPVLDPDKDNWSRRPNAMNCSFSFSNWAPDGAWTDPGQTFTCNASQPVSWVSLGISGVNHSHGSYVAFDCDTRDN